MPPSCCDILCMYGWNKTYSSPASHGPQKRRINLNNLLNSLTSDPIPGGSPAIRRDDDTSLKAKGERRCAVGQFDGTRGVGMVRLSYFGARTVVLLWVGGRI